LLPGAIQLTCASLLAGSADTFVGADGAVAAIGTTEFDAADTGPEPIGLDACTVNVYVVPAVNPVTDAVVAGGDPVTVVGVCAADPTYGVTVYDAGGPPDDGADHDTVAPP
jgi:hypothetical protein